ncbi:MAG: nodW1 [Candidatus Sulfotelmatobacter sp.]|nr:nodW1 [Candidatus Sulfotelmatobacter sp.]
MTERASTVLVLDDDVSIRNTLRVLLRSVGLNAEFFDSPFEFMQEVPRLDAPSCLVLDVRLPGKSGLDLQRELTEKGIPLPIIFLTAHGDIPMAVRAMKAGAVEFLTKPFRDQDLLDAIQVALERDRDRRERQAKVAILLGRLQSLTPREREVLPLVVSGMLNKQVAAEIGTTEATIKVHRSQLMKKMGAKSVPELVRMADKMGIDGVGIKGSNW